MLFTCADYIRQYPIECLYLIEFIFIFPPNIHVHNSGRMKSCVKFV